MRCGEGRRQRRALEFHARGERIEAVVDRLDIGLQRVEVLDFIHVDRKHQPVAGVKTDELQHQFRRAVFHHGADLIDALVFHQRPGKRLVDAVGRVSRAGVGFDRVEEHIARVETGGVLVAADPQSLQLSSRCAALESDDQRVAMQVAADVLFDVDRSHLHRLDTQQQPRLHRFHAAHGAVRRGAGKSSDVAQRLAAEPPQASEQHGEQPPCSRLGCPTHGSAVTAGGVLETVRVCCRCNAAMAWSSSGSGQSRTVVSKLPETSHC